MTHPDDIAKIIDPDAWHETLPTDGCGVYWIGRRLKAREKACLIISLLFPAGATDTRAALATEAE